MTHRHVSSSLFQSNLKLDMGALNPGCRVGYFKEFRDSPSGTFNRHPGTFNTSDNFLREIKHHHHLLYLL
jgi:hypothetical protein